MGGKRIDNLIDVKGRSTFPASLILGNPSAPRYDNAGRQLRLRISSTRLFVTGFIFSFIGKRLYTFLSSTSAACSAC